MTAYRATSDLTAPGSDAPDLLLQKLEILLASSADGLLTPTTHYEAVALQREFMESVAANIAAMMGRGNAPEAVFTFLEPLLARL